MNNDAYESLKEAGRQSAFARMTHSIRTRYSLATAFFLLLCLGIFYVGGRIVLVHMMREAEQQVREIGYDISRMTYRHADEVRRQNATNTVRIAEGLANGCNPAALLREDAHRGVSVLLVFSESGEYVSGAARGPTGVTTVDETELAPYRDRVSAWIKAVSETNLTMMSVGIVQLCGRAHYVAVTDASAASGRKLVVGSAFDSGVFTSRVNESFTGLNVRVVDRKANVTVTSDVRAREGVGRSDERNSFGISPMLSEAINFYSGGFWELGSNPFEAVFAVRDIAGNAVSMISVSLPSTLTNVTSSALGRLTFFIAMAGIVLILPIFWFQSRVLLNPLTKMTTDIRKLGERHQDIDCPRLEWKGKDEFAMLALSVNSMLETISARAVKVAQVESRHRALIDGVPDALAIFDRRGRLVSISKQPEGTAPLPGFYVGEPPDAEIFGGAESGAFVNSLADVFVSNKVANVRLKVQRTADMPAGALTRHFEVRITRMDDVFALAIIRDVSNEVAEHKLRLAAEARANDSKKRESLTLLAAGLAHDMNNVLSVVLNAAESHDADPSGDSVRTLDTIRDAVRRGSSMMRELMTYAGENKMTFFRMSPKTILDDLVALAEHVVGKNIALTFLPVRDTPDVDADPNQFWKVLFNIVKNAGEAIGKRPGHIKLSASAFEMTKDEAVNFISEHPLPSGSGVVFRIEDDGPGIPADILSKIFDPYVSSKSVGRGLGLATVRTIVEAHGGGICVQSKVDHGTTFLIYLPETKLPREVLPAAQPSVAGKLPQEVLVVDDDEAILKTMSILLKGLKVASHVAHDRAEALAEIRRFPDQIGAILLDAHLGGVNVVRLLDAFRIANARIPVIISSGSSEDDIRKLFKGHPYDGFLTKPFTLVELKTVLLACEERR